MWTAWRAPERHQGLHVDLNLYRVAVLREDRLPGHTAHVPRLEDGRRALTSAAAASPINSNRDDSHHKLRFITFSISVLLFDSRAAVYPPMVLPTPRVGTLCTAV